jgi:hypothetical protein
MLRRRGGGNGPYGDATACHHHCNDQGWPRTTDDVKGTATMQHLPRLDTVTSSFAESFDAPVLDPERWVDHYLPQWTTAERSQARYDLPGPGQPPGLRLRIDADQLDWRPEDAPLRVSNLQTAVFSGPLRSTRGTHRHRQDGLTVRTKVSPRLLWAPRFG